MTLLSFQCRDFRCLRAASLELDPRYNLIHGPNASGKTSLLEGIAYLGRGKSFRAAGTDRLLRQGTREFVLFGRVGAGGGERALGVQNGAGGLQVSVDGDRGTSTAELAELLPLQIVDPDVHDLVAGGPEERRRYVDWMAFHVEQGFLRAWRRFRKALRQRNAALRDQAGGSMLAGWDRELAVAGRELHDLRARTLALAYPVLARTAKALLGDGIGFEYRAGWPDGEDLEETLGRARERDRLSGSTQEGPHRADLRLSHDERQARKRVSRGQEKLLACSMILAATEVVQGELGRPLLLLLDDPAAELDAGSLDRLMAAVAALDCQVIATALRADTALFPVPPRRFHVEQGVISPVQDR
ncbi:MAG TPA: DNA replication/repair protein RecF [Woeseiaceae bacterium]|jgi:DNA replication and repair protein RecF|nr:DNA replication/repair protein RecF [Woeseiaceae bacterium]